MKNQMGLKVLGLVLGIVLVGSAQAASLSESVSCEPILWREVKNLALQCEEQLNAGEKCDAIQFFDDRSASFRLHGHEYQVSLVDSRFADGGDLNDLFIQRDDGCRLERISIPTFGDLLKALGR